MERVIHARLLWGCFYLNGLLLNIILCLLCFLNFGFTHGAKFWFFFELINQVFNSYSASFLVEKWSYCFLFGAWIHNLYKILSCFNYLRNISDAIILYSRVWHNFRAVQPTASLALRYALAGMTVLFLI